MIRLENTEAEPLPNWLVLGEVVGVHIDKQFLKDGVYQTVAAQPVMRAGGPASYFGISSNEEFELYRP